MFDPKFFQREGESCGGSCTISDLPDLFSEEIVKGAVCAGQPGRGITAFPPGFGNGFFPLQVSCIGSKIAGQIHFPVDIGRKCVVIIIGPIPSVIDKLFCIIFYKFCCIVFSQKRFFRIYIFICLFCTASGQGLVLCISFAVIFRERLILRIILFKGFFIERRFLYVLFFVLFLKNNLKILVSGRVLRIKVLIPGRVLQIIVLVHGRVLQIIVLVHGRVLQIIVLVSDRVLRIKVLIPGRVLYSIILRVIILNVILLPGGSALIPGQFPGQDVVSCFCLSGKGCGMSCQEKQNHSSCKIFFPFNHSHLIFLSGHSP